MTTKVAYIDHLYKLSSFIVSPLVHSLQYDVELFKDGLRADMSQTSIAIYLPLWEDIQNRNINYFKAHFPHLQIILVTWSYNRDYERIAALTGCYYYFAIDPPRDLLFLLKSLEIK